MSKKHRLYRLWSSVVLVALLIGALPAPALAQAPVASDPPPTAATEPGAIALPEDALILPEAETAAPTAPETDPPVEALTADFAPSSVLAPEACAAPGVVPFGQDLEFLAGPLNNNNTYAPVRPLGWSGASQSRYTPSTQNSEACPTNREPGPEQVLIFEHDYYEGSCRVMNVGSYPERGMLGIGNDKLSSLKIGANVEALLCRDENYGGICSTFQTTDGHVGNNDVGNDTVSSMKVIRTMRAYAVTAVPLGPDAAEVIFKTGGTTGDLVAQRWVLGWQHPVTTTYLGLNTPGTPVAVSRTPTDYSVAVRTTTGGIKVMHGTRDGGPNLVWEDIPGGYDADTGNVAPLTDVAGDPTLVALTPYTLKLFYRSSIDNSIKFTEWSAGYGWRSEPVSLGGTVYSDPVAVARDAGHIAVFGVGTNSSLYVKEWTAANQSDWSDVAWKRLTAAGVPYVKLWQKLSVASAHSNHIGLGFLTSANVVYYLEWTPAGWSTPTEIGGYVEPVRLVAAGTDDMALYGTNASGYLYTNHRTPSGGWQGWGLLESSRAATQPLAAVSFRPGEIVLFGRDNKNYLYAKSYTGGNFTATTTRPNTSLGVLRGQAIATVDAKTYWVSVYRHTDGLWYMAAKTTSTFNGVTVQLGDHAAASTATNNVSVTAVDLDRDGDDEIVIATLNSTGTTGRLSVRRLTVDGMGAVTGITSAAATDFSYTGATLFDVNVATGNVNNPTTTVSGLADEIVVAALRSGYNQVFLKTFRFTGSSLTALTGQLVTTAHPSSSLDLELTVAKVDANLVEKIFVGTYSSYVYPLGYLDQYRFGSTSYTLEQALSTGLMFSGPMGAYSSAIASGDIDSDGMEEVVYAVGSGLYVYPINGVLSTWSPRMLGAAGSRSLVIGDLDREGLAEVVLGDSRGVSVFRHLSYLGSSSPMLIGIANWPQAAVPLLADTDGDSLVATYLDCAPFEDRQVISVINAAPRWYWTNPTTQVFEPCSQAEGGVANIDSTETGDEKGWYTSIGASITVGFKQEISVIVKIGEFSNETTASFTAKVGQSTSTVDTETTMTGAEFQKPETGETTGRVCYLKTGYTCYAYNVSKPGTTGNSQIMMHCVPQSSQEAPHICASTETWYSTTSRNAAGTSWAPVGHRLPGTETASVSLNESGNYILPPGSGRAYPPVDDYLVWWDGYSSRVTLVGDANPTSGGYTWSFQRESAVGKTNRHSFEGSLSNASRAEVFGAVVGGSITVGAGGEFANSIKWSNGLEFSGKVYNFPNTCTTCQPYTVVPFVYQATAKTKGGDTYGYLEQDYYLATLGNLNQAQSAEPDATIQGVAGLAVAPLDPIITSSTHPNPATWYAGNTVTLNWSQPNGDPAALEGYKWELNQIADYAPTRSSVLTTTATYEALPDGLYYFHLQATGPGIDRSAVVHRAVRVDNDGPQVTFLTDPAEPNGYNGWFVSPVAVSLTATDTVGSGVSGIEVSTDGATWLPYTAALPVTADTAGDTVWARATDLVGNVSDPVSTTVKLDQTAPSTKEPNTPYHLSYTNIVTTEVGNAQLVMGGVLNDALSGRYQVEVKAGNLDLWHTVDAVGEFPMLPDNEITSTTQTTLNWIYTPTFSVRGVYPLWARGVDAAGNYEDDKLIAALWWEPDDIPVLSESQVTASPSVARPGDTIAFTIGARNSGYQEAQMLITNTVPAGLTVLPNTISDGGQYDEATRTIVWDLYALWPGETHYLYFSAAAGAVTEPITLENQVTMLGYWPWWDLSAYDPDFPDAPASHPYTTTNFITIEPGSGASSAPKVTGIAVVEGPVVTAPNVTILVNASPETRYLYVKEWVWDSVLGKWQLATESGWVPFESAPGFAVTQDAQGRYGRYAWTLSEGDGIKYLAVWIADGSGHVSNLNEGNLLYTNLLSTAGQPLAAGERVQYRLPARAQDLMLLNLLTLSGDADLYVWQPRAGFMPHFYSNGTGVDLGLSSDTVAFYAPEEGMYIVEVQAVTDSVYRLINAGTLSSATGADTSALADTGATLLPQSTHLALAEKDRPAHPLTLSSPLSGGDAVLLPGAPEAPSVYPVYLPQIYKQ